MIKFILKSINPLDEARYYNIQFASKLIAWAVSITVCVDLIMRFFGYSSDYKHFQADYNEILSNLIGTLTTIVVSSFTLIIVALQIASQQFSPRIIRQFFATDKRMQGFLGLYIGAILYCYLVKTLGIAQAHLNVAIVICIFLGFFCLVAFPLFITYYVDNINAASITEGIKNRIIAEIETLYQEKWTPDSPNLTYKRTEIDKSNCAAIIKIRSPFPSGYLDEVKYDLFVEMYCSFLKQNPNISIKNIHLKPIIGEFICYDTTTLFTIEIAQIFENEIKNDEAKAKINAAFLKIIEAVFVITKYRSYEQDINFGIRQLVDIGIRAISPAVNDPTTCLNCIDYLGEIVRQLGDREFPSTAAQKIERKDIHINEFAFEELVNFAFDQIYHWGKNDPAIVKRLINTLSAIVQVTQNPYSLYVLILQMQGMELDDILSKTPEQLTEADRARFTLENRRSISREILKFNKKAKEQINCLEQQGVLRKFERSSFEINATETFYTKTRQKEVESIDYLRNF